MEFVQIICVLLGAGVIIDAKKQGRENKYIIGWGFAVMLFPITLIALPAYLIKRNKHT